MSEQVEKEFENTSVPLNENSIKRIGSAGLLDSIFQSAPKSDKALTSFEAFLKSKEHHGFTSKRQQCEKERIFAHQQHRYQTHVAHT